MHRFAHHIITTKRKRDIAHATADFCSGAQLLDLTGRINKVDRIFIMLFDARCYGKNIGIKNNILRFEADLFGKNTKRPRTDLYFRSVVSA
jgi:hypothetical protein